MVEKKTDNSVCMRARERVCVRMHVRPCAYVRAYACDGVNGRKHRAAVDSATVVLAVMGAPCVHDLALLSGWGVPPAGQQDDVIRPPVWV